MNSRVQVTLGVLLSSLVVHQAQAAFTSLYVFGDTTSTTLTNHGSIAYLYFGGRFSNGRIWVELLAQQLNLTNNYWYSNNPTNHLSYTNLSASSTNWSYSSNNLSYFDHNSSKLVNEVSSLIAPPDASNALFIIWVSDADLYDAIWVHKDGVNMTKWTNDINLCVSNQFKAITNLYFAKGVRTLLMPNAVDMSEIPFFSGSSQASFIRQRCIDCNTAFDTMLSNAMVTCPGLTIYEPDFFSLLDNILANPAAYGVTNALENGHTIDALEDPSLTDYSLNGPGANYIFWDWLDPTAKVHAIMAGLAKQLIAPVRFNQITAQNGTNQLNLTNVPVGLNGVVLGNTNLALTNWTFVANFNSTNNVLPVFVPASGPMQFYRLKFPYSWTWP